MRILIFHGYLLRGTGSNIYNASLVRALARLGHEVDLLCQDRDWDAPEGVHDPQSRTSAGSCPSTWPTATRASTRSRIAELSEAELEHYLDAERSGRRRTRPTPDVALANHLVMGPVILARALAGRAPYAVKVHGSALEYTVRPHRERFLPYALEGVRGAPGVLVGSRHTAESLWEVLADEPGLPERTRLGPPGRGRAHVQARRRRPASGSADRVGWPRDAAAWGGEAGAADALRSLDPRTRPDRQLRRQADRVEGRRPAAGRVAAGGGARAGGAARDRRASAPTARRSGASWTRCGGATSTTCARSRRAAASWRAARPAS